MESTQDSMQVPSNDIKQIWDGETLEKYITEHAELDILSHPDEVILGHYWKDLFIKLRNRTKNSGKEWSVKIVALDTTKQPSESVPSVDYKEYFPEFWGTDTHPMFQTYLDEGGPVDTGDETSFVPPIIIWDGKDTCTKTVSYIHSHTQDLPLSIIDMCLTNTKNLPLTSFVVTPKHIYLLIRSTPLDQSSMNTISEHWKTMMREKLLMIGKPNILFRFFGKGDPAYSKRYKNVLMESIIEFCNHYKLSFYQGNTTDKLTRLNSKV